ncbi:hypothetical protein GOODEAATRI_008932 [Goodea atripinnis]|uniref:Uncharacterized protein n=1 Tax=Goodea atripinnis TaxID=208336 RepID=A0ABV0N947_9TELE
MENGSKAPKAIRMAPEGAPTPQGLALCTEEANTLTCLQFPGPLYYTLLCENEIQRGALRSSLQNHRLATALSTFSAFLFGQNHM